jgi:hypothetical protein
VRWFDTESYPLRSPQPRTIEDLAATNALFEAEGRIHRRDGASLLR